VTADGRLEQRALDAGPRGGLAGREGHDALILEGSGGGRAIKKPFSMNARAALISKMPNLSIIGMSIIGICRRGGGLPR
jgi:hypothetical protein